MGVDGLWKADTKKYRSSLRPFTALYLTPPMAEGLLSPGQVFRLDKLLGTWKCITAVSPITNSFTLWGCCFTDSLKNVGRVVHPPLREFHTSSTIVFSLFIPFFLNIELARINNTIVLRKSACQQPVRLQTNKASLFGAVVLSLLVVSETLSVQMVFDCQDCSVETCFLHRHWQLWLAPGQGRGEGSR